MKNSKRLMTLAAVLLMGISLFGQTGNMKFADAETVCRQLTEGKGDSLYLKMSDTMKAHIDAQQLSGLMAMVQMQCGGLQETGAWTSEEKDGYEVFYRNMKFEKADLHLVLTMKDGKVEGLFMRPGKAPTLPADEGGKPVTIETDGYQLPGTLVLPEPGNVFPAPCVILVHGSGPNDRDETVGPNKPFKDLSDGLSRRGIAVLRYDKRTRLYADFVPQGKKMNYDTETVDDAVQAVEVVRQIEAINPHKIVIVGHSLGAMLAPRIAQKAKEVAALVMIAPAANNLAVTVESQKKRLKLSENERLALDMSMKSIPASYWKADADYHAVREAAGLALPILVLQGEKDFQVTMDDFALWKKGLRKHKNAMLKSYPGLNHLMMPSRDIPGPGEYETAGHVSEAVIDDIAAFIHKLP